MLARDPKIHLLMNPWKPRPAVSYRHAGRTGPFTRGILRTCVYVTHDQAEAMTLGQRICAQMAVLQIGTPDEIYNQPAHRFVQNLRFSRDSMYRWEDISTRWNIQSPMADFSKSSPFRIGSWIHNPWYQTGKLGVCFCPKMLP